MSFLDRIAQPLERLPGMKKRAVRVATAVVLLLLAAVLLALVAMLVLPLLPARFWQVLALCLVAFAVLWWFASGAKRFSRRGFARKRIGDLGPGNPEDEKVALERMRTAIAQARQTIQRSPEIGRGRDPLYRIPWMLFVGDEQAGVDGLLRAANRVSPFPPPDPQPDGYWRWWFFKSMIAIETPPSAVCDASARVQRGLWYQALMLLSTERDKLPLNGIVVCMGARTLLAGPDAVRPVAMRLRRLVDEALEHLQVQLPVYLVVTGLDQVPGYGAFAAVVPEQALAQAVGHRLSDTEEISAATGNRLEELYAPIVRRLHALRITALRGQATPAGRRAIYEFVEHVRALEPGLETLIGLMLEDNPFQRTPRWRGLFLTGSPPETAAGKSGAAGGFLDDLFTRFLPADQPLASPSFRGNAGKMAIAAVGVGAMLGLSAMLSYGFVNARQDDGRLLAQTQTACREPSDAVAAARIGWLARCGRTIEQLEVARADTGLGFGLRRADADIERMKEQVLRDFSNLILAPYDQIIETDLARNQAGLEHLLAVSQRLRMLDHCRRQSDACQQEAATNLAFDQDARPFSPFVSGEQDARADREHAAALLTTYMGYLRWQQSATLDAEAQRLRTLLARLLAAHTPRPDDVRAWADQRRDPIALTAFWLPPDRVVGVEAAAMPSVSAAFTRQTWQEVLAPMLRTAADAVPERKPVLETFRAQYFSEYFRAWGRFQARFFEGTRLWRPQLDAMGKRAGTAEDPYLLLAAVTDRDLQGLDLALPLGTRWTRAWARAKGDWLDAWRPLGGFMVDAVTGMFRGWWGAEPIQPPSWLLAEIDTTERVLRPRRPDYARAYLRLRADTSGQDAYDIAAELFRAKGAPPQPPAADYAALLSAVDKPGEQFAAVFKGDDLAAWSVVQGPSRLLLYLTVQRAGQFVQARWNESVVAALRGMPPKEQVDALYGEQGRLTAFVKDWLQPFITERERTPTRIAGIGLPLSSAYQGMVAAERRILSTQVNKPFLAGSFQFSQPTRMGAASEGPQGTVLEVVCRERTYLASTRAESLAEATAQVFWSPDSCIEARLHISLPAPPEAPAAAAPGAMPGAVPAPVPATTPPPPLGPRLTLIYPGAEGFATLISDFRSGSHAFRLPDFRTSYGPIQWKELSVRLAQQGFTEARVFMDVRPSDEMLRFLNARTEPAAALPTSILE